MITILTKIILIMIFVIMLKCVKRFAHRLRLRGPARAFGPLREACRRDRGTFCPQKEVLLISSGVCSDRLQCPTTTGQKKHGDLLFTAVSLKVESHRKYLQSTI